MVELWIHTWGEDGKRVDGTEKLTFDVYDLTSWREEHGGDEKEAKDMGNTISESGITCVIKQTKFESSFKEVIEKQDYEAIIKEVGS